MRRAGVDPALGDRLGRLCAEGWDLWDAFDREVRDLEFHPFVAADYEVVLEALVRYRRPGLRFLEWGSATGVITIMADLLGYEARGIELDGSLVATARRLATGMNSGAQFVTGSFVPTGYQWRDAAGDQRPGTLGTGPSGYLQFGLALDDFDVVFGYPWPGEEPMMLDLMASHGRPDALLLIHGVTAGVTAYRGGRVVDATTPPTASSTHRR